MKKNLGTFDRIVRLIFGLLLLLYAWWQVSWIALIFALFTFYEAFASWCIIYQLLGINRCPLNQNKKK